MRGCYRRRSLVCLYGVAGLEEGIVTRPLSVRLHPCIGDMGGIRVVVTGDTRQDRFATGASRLTSGFSGGRGDPTFGDGLVGEQIGGHGDDSFKGGLEHGGSFLPV